MLKFLIEIENSRILVVVFVSKLSFSFSFRFVDENYRIFVVIVVFVTKINLFSSTKIFIFIVVDEKTLVPVFHNGRAFPPKLPLLPPRRWI